MKAYAIALIACGATIVTVLVVYLLICLCKRGPKKEKNNQSYRPSSSPLPVYSNVQPSRGISNKGTKDGGMVLMVGAGATLASAAAVDVITCTTDGNSKDTCGGDGGCTSNGGGAVGGGSHGGGGGGHGGGVHGDHGHHGHGGGHDSGGYGGGHGGCGGGGGGGGCGGGCGGGW